MGATDYKQPMPEPFPLNSLDVPVFDIYGGDDYPAVGRLAPGRWQQIQQAGNPLSRHRLVDDADHYFTDRGDDLVEPVGKWLDSFNIK
jgi:pimeloyl-ACP methyl ester carboxylesterase